MGDLKVGDLAAADESAEPDSLGINKTVFIKAIKDFQVPFSVMFMESCDSELPESLVLDLRQSNLISKTDSTIGAMYTSDRTGLKFETVDYGSLQPLPGDSQASFGVSLQSVLDRVAAK
jgi:hypothetical protein